MKAAAQGRRRVRRMAMRWLAIVLVLGCLVGLTSGCPVGNWGDPNGGEAHHHDGDEAPPTPAAKPPPSPLADKLGIDPEYALQRAASGYTMTETATMEVRPTSPL